jgi:cobalt-zinc-cadmium resistance protein CzcA
MGETNYLEKLTGESKREETRILYEQSKRGLDKAYAELKSWLQTEADVRVEQKELPRLEIISSGLERYPGLEVYQKTREVSQQLLHLEKQYLWPDLSFSVFTGTNNAANAERYSGFQAGLAIPLWFGAKKAKIKAAKLGVDISQHEFENYRIQLEYRLKALTEELAQYREAVDYYTTSGKELSAELVTNANAAYKQGEIDFLQYIHLLDNARSIKINYLENLLKYDLRVLEINHILKN